MYLFYVKRSGSNFAYGTSSLGEGYLFNIWRPDARNLVPCGLSIVPYGVWWGFHHLHVFSNRDYAMLTIYDGDRLIHRSGIFPRYFRFPFMARDDLQIGDTWTHPDYRGRGLATFALQKIVEAYSKSDRTFWYIVEQENSASIHVAEKVGFELFGRGIRAKRFGIGILGALVIQQIVAFR